MKSVAILTALALASAALLAVGAPEGREGRGAMAERFKQADTNGDGRISAEEAKALPRIGRHFKEIDVNGDGQVTAEELKAFHEKSRADHWKKLDTDGDGKVSLAEAKANAPRLAEHFGELDANKDGFLTPDEMRAARGHRRSK